MFIDNIFDGGAGEHGGAVALQDREVVDFDAIAFHPLGNGDMGGGGFEPVL